MSDVPAYPELGATVRADARNGIIVETGMATVDPETYPLRIYQNSTWQLNVTWWNAPQQPVDLSAGYSASFVVRHEMDGDVLISLTNGVGITLADGQPNIVIDRNVTQVNGYTWGPRAQYSLMVTRSSDSRVFPLLVGTIDLVPVV